MYSNNSVDRYTDFFFLCFVCFVFPYFMRLKDLWLVLFTIFIYFSYASIYNWWQRINDIHKIHRHHICLQNQRLSFRFFFGAAFFLHWIWCLHCFAIFSQYLRQLCQTVTVIDVGGGGGNSSGGTVMWWRRRRQWSVDFICTKWSSSIFGFVLIKNSHISHIVQIIENLLIWLNRAVHLAYTSTTRWVRSDLIKHHVLNVFVPICWSVTKVISTLLNAGVLFYVHMWWQSNI